jgi:hypothetical protein
MREPQLGENMVIDEFFETEFKGYFVDIGAGCRWSNTDYLKERGWTGLQLDDEYGQHITVENVNEYLKDVPDPFDFLSMDIDGNDYWVWKAMNKKARLVCIEFNPHPNKVGITPYDPDFRWDGKKTPDFGASMEEMIKLGAEIGYPYHMVKDCNLFFKK